MLPPPPQTWKCSPWPSGIQHEGLVSIREINCHVLSFHQGRLDAKLICAANLDNGYKFLNHLKHNNTKAFTTVGTRSPQNYLCANFSLYG